MTSFVSYEQTSASVNIIKNENIGKINKAGIAISIRQINGTFFAKLVYRSNSLSRGLFLLPIKFPSYSANSPNGLSPSLSRRNSSLGFTFPFYFITAPPPWLKGSIIRLFDSYGLGAS